MISSFPKVKTFSGLKVGRVYSTTNYEMFIPFVGNRGQVNGLVAAKVKYFKNLILNGEMYDVIMVHVNLLGKIIDGHHKLEAARQLNRPVTFLIYDEWRFNNGTDSEILIHIAKLNYVNSRWTPKEHYRAALMGNQPCASAIDRITAEMLNTYGITKVRPVGIKRQSLSPGRILSLAKCFKDGIKNTSFTLEAYCDIELSKVILSTEFKRVLSTICEIMLISRTEGNSREWELIQSIATKEIRLNTKSNIIDYTLEFNYWLTKIKDKPSTINSLMYV